MSRPASRILALLELLQAHHRLTGPQLAARLGVDERTVRRYAGALAELGIPVTAIRGRYGGYRLSPGFKLPPLMLTDDEAVAVVLGLVAADRLGLTTQAPAAESAQAKITRVLPAVLRDRLEGLRQHLGFTLDRRAATTLETEVLLALGSAARGCRRIGIDYRSRPPAPTPPPAAPAVRRDVDPYGLVFHRGRWYLVGHDHLRGEIRTFRVDRVAAVQAGTATFVPPPGFDAVAHVRHTLAEVPWTHRVEVLLEADLDQVRRRVPATVARLTPTADGVVLTAGADDLTGMAQLLAGLGCPFTVLRPDALRGAVAGLAAALAGYAGRAPGPSTPAVASRHTR